MSDPREVVEKALTDYATELDYADALPWKQQLDGAAGVALQALASAGYRVVQEGQAVVDGKVWRLQVEYDTPSARYGPYYRLIPPEDSDD